MALVSVLSTKNVRVENILLILSVYLLRFTNLNIYIYDLQKPRTTATQTKECYCNYEMSRNERETNTCSSNLKYILWCAIKQNKELSWKTKKGQEQLQRLRVYNWEHNDWEEILNIKSLRDKLHW